MSKEEKHLADTQTQEKDELLIIGSHWIINVLPSALEQEKKDKIRNIINLDLFHQDEMVSTSAIKLLSKIGNKESIDYLLIILNKHNKTKQLAAIKTLENIGSPALLPNLLTAFNEIPDEEVRADILMLLTKWDSANEQVRKHIEFYSSDNIPDTPIKFAAIECLGILGEADSIRNIISATKKEEIFKSAVLALADCSGFDVTRTIPLILNNYSQMNDELKLSTVETLAKLDRDQVIELLKNSVSDESDEFVIRLINIITNYKVFYRNHSRTIRYIFFKMAENSDMVEEYIYSGFEEYYNGFKTRKLFPQVDKKQINKIIQEIETSLESNLRSSVTKLKLYKKDRKSSLTEFERKLYNAREFLEKFSTEQFRNEVIKCMRNSRYNPDDPGYLQIKNSLKVKSREIVRDYSLHVKDLQSLLDSQDQHERIRIAQFLQNVDAQKPILFRRLSRLLHFVSLSRNRKCIDLAYEIYKWAIELYDIRLQNTALIAMARSGNRNTLKEVTETLHSQNDPEILRHAIQAIGEFEKPEGLPLLIEYVHHMDLLNTDDILQLSIIEAFTKIAKEGNYEIMICLRRLFLESPFDTVVFQAALLIGKIAPPQMVDKLIEIKENPLEKIRELLVNIVGNIQKRDPDPVNKKRYQDFYYLMLRDKNRLVRIQAARHLYRMGDEDVFKVIFETLDKAQPKQKTDIIRMIMEIDHPDNIDKMLSLLRENNEEIVNTVAMSLVSLIENKSKYIDYITQRIISIRAGEKADTQLEELRSTGKLVMSEQKVDEKQKFWFEKENTQHLAVLFIDIVGYTKKSSSMDLVTVMNYLRSYEEIVLPVVENHRGRLVKKMGDGLMISFNSSINAVLAGFRIQERLKSYNKFKDGVEKIIVRVGINTGSVAVSENDLFGDTVNVASRMETTAKPGSILISEASYEEVNEVIQCKPMGPTMVKGKVEPIETFEVINITAALPDELDPLKNPDAGASAVEVKTKAQTSSEFNDPKLDKLKGYYSVLYKEINTVPGLSSKDRERIKKIISGQWQNIKKLMSE